MQSVERASLPEQVFRRLAEGILSGRYGPGERLPPQRVLAAELDVNMASLREGIKRLEQLKLVEVRHGDAMRVRDWRAHGGLDVLVHAAAAQDLGPELLSALFEARRLLLAQAAGLAAQRRGEEHVARLGELVVRLEQAEDDTVAQGCDFAFFLTVVEAAGNIVLLLITNSIRDLYFERLQLFRPIVTDRAGLLPLYRRTAQLIAAGEPNAAAEAATALTAAQEERLLGPGAAGR